MLGYTYTAVPAPIRSTRTEMGMGHTHSAQRLHESHMHEKHMHNLYEWVCMFTEHVQVYKETHQLISHGSVVGTASPAT